MTELEACPHCSRHVKVDEKTCPFCARSLHDAFANRGPRAMPQRRLGRAATFAFGLGVVAMQGACNEDQSAQADGGTTDAGHDAATDSATPDAGEDAATPDSGGDAAAPDSDGGPIPIYAAAPTPDDGSRVAIRLPTDTKRKA